MELLHVVGARPNFMKIAPIMAALRRRGIRQRLVHTGQHYDASMSDVFFRDLGLPAPDRSLGVGSGTHAEQTARIMIELERVFLEARPDAVVVVGDVNSTMAAALVTAKLCIPTAHVEAGLRSFDRSMPEEINRVVTDHVCDLLLTPSADADANLLKEGIDPHKIVRVGNVMIDSLLANLEAARARAPLSQLDVEPQRYALVTLHRPSNVDDEATLGRLLGALERIASRLPVVFPVHPRTRMRIASAGIQVRGVRLIGALGYLEFLGLTAQAALVLTDSGGLQEETTALSIPCLTLRERTERPITVTHGSNRVVGVEPDRIVSEAMRVLDDPPPRRPPPELWDGRAGERVADALLERWRKA